MHTRVLALALFVLVLACNARTRPEEKDPIRLANEEWRIHHKYDEALARLRDNTSHDARIEVARIALERGDYATARAEARKASAAAKTPRERQRAGILFARIVDRDPRASAEEMRATMESMREIIAEAGPLLAPSRLLARAALRVGDGPAALEGINFYYRVSAFAAPPKTIAAAHADLTRILSAWRGAPEERPAIARALGGIRFIDEVLLVTNEGDVAKYASALRRVEKATNEYYRQIALGNEDDDVLRDMVERELPKQDELSRRYGAVILVGKTSNHVDLHLGHIVDERNMRVEQYGHSATLRFVALDSMTSNGYSQWLSDGRSGDGGWGTAEEIVQVRPLYADGALREWQLVSDPVMRAEDERKAAEETAKDAEREKENPIQQFAGVERRLRRQYLDSVVAELRAKGLQDAALRDAFIARVNDEHFASSIVLHEGRHAIDAAEKRKGKVWEMEYRAKLAALALAPSAREALADFMGQNIDSESTHGKANGKLARELAEWMSANRASIAGLDTTRAMLPQIDKLTDEQIRAAARSLDQLAR